MSDLKEYIITLNNFEDLDEFYIDMETLRPTMYGVMPERAVDCYFRRPSSRNTHYKLTDDEVEKLKTDPRILAIELSPEELGLEITPLWTQTSVYWDKSSTNTVNAHRNWGLYRCATLTAQLANWGFDGTTLSASGTVNVTASGKNVDVIIIDGHLDPTHPEFSSTPDGTGGSRVNQINWLAYNTAVTGSAAGTYVYAPYVDPNYTDSAGNLSPQRTDDNNHGAHVAGTSCGNTQGWARDANIYNISPYSTNPNYTSVFGGAYGSNAALTVFDFVKQFHLNKPINRDTGRANPTICTNSWGYSIKVYIKDILSSYLQGVTANGPFTDAQILNANLTPLGPDSTGNKYVMFPYRITSLAADIADCIAAGIICVGAAGNNYVRGAKNSSDSRWNDYIYATYNGNNYNFYFARGSSPGADMICVGATNAGKTESKANYSNTGPQVDIFAPGSYIMSSVNDTSGSPPGTYDSRNASYYLTKYSGTSMATPQVTGVLACLLETYPNIDQTRALAYLLKYAFSGQLYDSANWPNDYYDLQGAPNRLLRYRLERPINGVVYPKVNTNSRPSSGHVFPRNRIYRYGPEQGLV
jgi:Subtilase family